MPLWNAATPVPALQRNIPVTLFGPNDTVVDDDTSIAVAVPPRKGKKNVITWELRFPDVAPTQVLYFLEGALVNEDDRYYEIDNISNVEGAIVISNNSSVLFVRVRAEDQGDEDVEVFVMID